MRTQELRIGNYVQEGIVQGLISDRIIIEKLAIHRINIQPIPLTEEILLKSKFGVSFTSDPLECGASKMYNIGSFKIHQPDEDNLFFVFVIDNGFIQLKYLHQLQNLYFALTGEELKINL